MKFTQQPSEILDYDIDLTDWMATGDGVSNTTVSATSGLTTSVSNANTATPKIWCSGGVNGTTYKVTATVVTTDGRTKEIDFKITVSEI